MSNVLLLLSHANGSLDRLSLRGLSAALLLDHECTGLLLNADPSVEAEALEYLPQLIPLQCSSETGLLPEQIAPLLTELISLHGYSHIMATDGEVARASLPRAAALCDAACLSGITGVLSSTRFARDILAGNASVVATSHAPVTFILLRDTHLAPPQKLSHAGHKIEVQLAAPPAPGTRVTSRSVAERKGPSLNTARVVIGVGRGVGDVDTLPPPIAELARHLGAAIGGTRATCDSGLFPGDLQIGQTGRIIAPECYVAIGVSGAVQHMAGVRNAKKCIAVNCNELAPIFELCDVGYVGRWEESIEELCKALSEE